MHASSTGSLDTWTTGQASLELEKSAADLVLHGGSALLVVDSDGGCVGAGGPTEAATKEAATGLGSTGGSGGGVASAGWGAATAAKDGAMTSRAGSGNVAVSSGERHDGCCLMMGWFIDVVESLFMMQRPDAVFEEDV